MIAARSAADSPGRQGLAIDPATLALTVVVADDPAVLVHDKTNRTIAHLLVDMPVGAFPMALGVIYEGAAPTLESAMVEQNPAAPAGRKPGLQKLLSKGQTCTADSSCT